MLCILFFILVFLFIFFLFKQAVNKERLKHNKQFELSIAKLRGIEHALESRVVMVINYFSILNK